ncbi:MAG: S8 family peptidase [Bacteroidetes bacterium]|nr:S8 family peptidase [Bacteroidota bacterium]
MLSLFIIAIIALLAGGTEASGQPCLKLALPHDPANGYFNPDSVMVDSCATPLRYYAKEWYKITFTIDPFFIPEAPRGTIIERTWHEIDSNYYTLKIEMSILDSAFGNYKFRKEYPDIVDSSSAASTTYLIRFDSLTRIDSVVTLLRASTFCREANYRNRAAKLLGMPLNEPGMLFGNPQMYNGTNFENFRNSLTFTNTYHKLGMQYHLWAINAPMAWKITEGKPDITIAVYDGWDSRDVISDTGHGTDASEDLYMRINKKENGGVSQEPNTENGNFIFNLKKDLNNKWERDPGDGSIPLCRLTHGHGMGCASIAVVAKNDKGMVGVAPKCSVVGINIGNVSSLIDVDNSKKGIQPPDVFSCSVHNVALETSEFHMENGSVVVGVNSAAGSIIKNDVKALAIVPNIGDGYTSAFIYKHPGNNATEDDDESYDLKKYRVFPFNNGSSTVEWVDPCMPLCTRENKIQKIVPFDFKLQFGSGMIGSFQHYYDGDFEHQITACEEIAKLNKHIYFPNRETLLYQDLRWDNFTKINEVIQKNKATMDIAAPSQDILIAGYDEKDLMGRYWVSSGPSFGIPQIAGTVALIKSVDKYLGVPLNNNLPTNPLSVSGKAFDIVTFTAKKIIAPSQYAYNGQNDNIEKDSFKIRIGNSSAESSFAQNKNELSSAFDPLQRSFSNTCGYGFLDAFRCVAHAIPDKKGSTVNVKYKYDANDALDWENAHVLDDKQFLHLGKFKNENDRVLEKGGNFFDEDGNTEPIWKNNHGKTVVNTDLSTGDNQVLVIDGIMTTDGTAGQHTITTTDEGKILITGYLKNVNLAGNICFADLNVYSISVPNNPEAVTNISIKQTSTESNQSEIYGKLTLFGGTNLTVGEGANLTIMPGGSINLNEKENIVVKNGATLTMEYASSITQSPMTGTTPRIIIENGGKLVVESKARAVELVAMVQIEEGGEFIIKDTVGIKLYGFKIESNGTMKVGKGSDIELISNKEWFTYWSKGKLLLNDSTISDPSANLPYPHPNRVTISGRRDNCGNVIEPAIIYCTGGVVEKTGDVFTYHGFLSVRNTDFLDVRLYLRNMKVLGDAEHNGNTIENCAFFANSTANPNVVRLQNLVNPSTEDKGIGIVGPLLQIDFVRPSPFRAYWNLHRADIDKITVKGCTFKDNAGSKENPADWQNENSTNKERYHVSGVAFNGMYSAVDENSTHVNLRHGVYSDMCSDVLVHRTGTPTGNNFETCDFGILDMASSVKVCNNSFNITGAAISLNGSHTSVIVDNSINNVGRGSDLESTTIHHHRANSFNSYLHGITVKAAYANLRPIYIIPGPYNCAGCPPPVPYDVIWGRNKFDIEPLPSISSEWPIYTEKHPFLKQNNFFGRQGNADCYFANDETNKPIDAAQFYMNCGYNDMAQYSQYHISSFFDRTGITTVGVEYNEMNPSCSVRNYQVIVNNPVNCDKEEAPGCTDIIAPPNSCSTLPNPVCLDSIPNDGSWAKLDAGGFMLTHLNTVSLQMLHNTSLGVDCRRVKAFDAHQTAFLLIEDSTRVAIAAVSNAFANIIADTSEPAALRSTAILLKADIHERLGEFDSAVTLYAQHAIEFDSTADMHYASWRSDALAARLTDTTHGVVYDSLMGVLHERICVDKFGAYSPPLVKPGHDNYPATGKAATSLTVHPNPFGNSTTVQWQLTENAHVRIVVTDALGRVVSQVFNGQCNTGVYSAYFNSTELPAGVYYCRLETMGTTLTRQITLIR